MLFRTDFEYFEEARAAELTANPAVSEWLLIGQDEVRVTYAWVEDFDIHPLDTVSERRQYDSDVHRWMGRAEAAGVFETLAIRAGVIVRPLCIADAAVRLALNACTEDYMPLIVEGFDKPDITTDQARVLLLEVSREGYYGDWPKEHCTIWDYEHVLEFTHDEQSCDQYIRNFGAAISLLIDPAWSTELRARLDHLRLMRDEELARRIAAFR